MWSKGLFLVVALCVVLATVSVDARRPAKRFVAKPHLRATQRRFVDISKLGGSRFLPDEIVNDPRFEQMMDQEEEEEASQMEEACPTAFGLRHAHDLALTGQAMVVKDKLGGLDDRPDEVNFDTMGIGSDTASRVNSDVESSKDAKNLGKLHTRLSAGCDEMRAMKTYLLQKYEANTNLRSYKCTRGSGARLPSTFGDTVETEDANFALKWKLDDETGDPTLAAYFDTELAKCATQLRALETEQAKHRELEQHAQDLEQDGHSNHIHAFRQHKLRVFEEQTMLEDVRSVTTVTSKWLGIGSILAGVGCLIATIATAGAAAPVCLIIGITFALTKMVSDLTLCNDWMDVLKTVAWAGVNTALSFVSGTAGLIITGVEILASTLLYAVKGVPGTGLAAYNQGNKEPAGVPNESGRCPHSVPSSGILRPFTPDISTGGELETVCGEAMGQQHGPAYKNKVCAIVANPHPAAWSGSPRYNYEVVVDLATAMRLQGYTTFSFNYHGGSGRWTSGGDAEDTAALADWVAQQQGCDYVAMVGFSFGAAMAASAMAWSDAVIYGIIISPPFSVVGLNWYSAHFSRGAEIGKLVSFVKGAADEMCSESAFTENVGNYPHVFGQGVIPNGNHVWQNSRSLTSLIEWVGATSLGMAGRYFR